MVRKLKKLGKNWSMVREHISGEEIEYVKGPKTREGYVCRCMRVSTVEYLTVLSKMCFFQISSF